MPARKMGAQWEGGTHLFDLPVVSDKVDISSLFIHSLGVKTTSLCMHVCVVSQQALTPHHSLEQSDVGLQLLLHPLSQFCPLLTRTASSETCARAEEGTHTQ